METVPKKELRCPACLPSRFLLLSLGHDEDDDGQPRCLLFAFEKKKMTRLVSFTLLLYPAERASFGDTFLGQGNVHRLTSTKFSLKLHKVLSK